ncbi:MAG TPA: prolyl oligopeptidase family serine peptidase [Gemmatimonadaceae bacterium]|nr:prolyl oligopeptidase family serine peptidase [Gemmatimonadaceae bacterium]
MPLVLPRVMRRAAAVRVAALLLTLAPVADAQEGAQPNGAHAALAAERYVKPAPEIVRLVTAPRHLNATLEHQSPGGRYFLDVQSAGLPAARTFARRWHNLGGLQVDPRANRARTLTTKGASAIAIIDATSGTRVTIAAPRGALLSGPAWSPDRTRIAYFASFDDATYVYVADAATGRARRLGPAVLATLVTTPAWAGNGAIAAVVIPGGRGAEPTAAPVAVGPFVRMTDGVTKVKTRTYADLLEGPLDMALVEYHTTGQLALLDARSGAVRRVGGPQMIQSVDPSPDGRYLRVTLMQKPFSYVMPVSGFGRAEQLWDQEGRMIAELSRRALRETDIDDDDSPASKARQAAIDTMKRAVAWLPNGEGLSWLKQEPAPARDSTADSSSTPTARRRDRLHIWRAPFTTEPETLVVSTSKIAEVLFSADAQTILVAETSSGTGHVYAVRRAAPAKRHTIWRMRGLTAALEEGRGGFGGRDGGAEDSTAFYRHPGYVVTSPAPGGTTAAVVSPDGKHIFLRGIRHAKTYLDTAPRPFVDRVQIETGVKTRIFESPAQAYESVVAPLDHDFTRFVVSRETATEVPNYFTRAAGASEGGTRLTSNRDYTPEITGAPRRLIPVTRADGFTFWVNVILPPGYREGTRLPAMFWFYPYEYTDQESYDRTKRTYNRNRFPTLGPRSMEYLVTQGYAVVLPDAPIFGDRGRMNDNYVSDLRNNLSAVIDELDARGLIDRRRLGLGGHSYGAFSTVNAMVHTPFFKAGIAGDGNYNRTLTPNGFQSERRDLWAGRDAYLSMSPILYADKLQGALLMYHGEEDQNVGTAPINSERLFHALQGMGKTAALYMYPYEDHGPATEETLLDLWARWTAWLDLHVRNGGKPTDLVQ